MAPEKTDPDTSETNTPNTSIISLDTSTTEGEREPYFEPVVHLPEVEVKSNEEDEVELVKLRCKLFRYDTSESPAEWKERGTGDVKILHNLEKNTLRVLMRQDKTLKIRANHYITPFMELKPNCNSDRAWVWSAISDYADEECKHETFAIRFANSENARIFRDKFDDARGIVTVALIRGSELQQAAAAAASSKTKVAIVLEEDDAPEPENSQADLIAQEIEEKLKVSDDKEVSSPSKAQPTASPTKVE